MAESFPDRLSPQEAAEFRRRRRGRNRALLAVLLALVALFFAITVVKLRSTPMTVMGGEHAPAAQ